SARATECIDCEAPLVANDHWQNGLLASGEYYNPQKEAGNWGIATSIPGEGLLEMRYEKDIGYYVRNTCPSSHIGYCRVHLNQVITVQEGVAYNFDTEYQIRNARAGAQIDVLEIYVETLPSRQRLFSELIYAQNTLWTEFTTGSWIPNISGDVLLTFTWRNDASNAVVEIRQIVMVPLECQPPLVETSTKTCSEEPVPSSTAAPSSAS
ncbi:hypothetical protein B0T25DRAFT_427148, partial [Lasiosphaeria hispida]